MRYKFYVGGNKVACVSSYAKKTVRGVAKCNTSQDTFNEETGKKLAKLRCDKNIAMKRLKRSTDQYRASVAEYERAAKNMFKMQKYMDDSVVAYESASEALTSFESSI